MNHKAPKQFIAQIDSLPILHNNLINRSHTVKYLIISLICTFLSANLSAKDKGSLQSTMQDMKGAITKIIPVAHRSENTLSNSELNDFKKNLQTLKKKSHILPDKLKQRQTDPLVTYMTQQFSSEIDRAQYALNNNNVPFAKYTAKRLTSYCLGCHLNTEGGRLFTDSELRSTLKGLNLSEQASFYASTRNYDTAMELIANYLKSSEASPASLDWEHNLRLSFEIATKSQKPIKNLNSLIGILKGQKDLPGYLQSDIEKWKESVNTWQKHRTAMTSENRIHQAEKLLNETLKKQEFIGDHGSDIDLLRVNKALRTELNTLSSSPNKNAKLFFLLGKSYESLQGLDFWNLQDVYYEACIKEASDKPLAIDCFHRLEKSVRFGYTGSSGTHLPKEVSKKLMALKAIANSK
jgi:hypothetical protein